MHVRDAMATTLLTVGPGHTLRQAAERMTERNVGSAIVLDPDGEGPGIITERDVLRAIGAGEDPDTTEVAGHAANNLTVAAPTMTLDEAAKTMVRGGFRHLIVVDGSEVVGIVSMRDVVRTWVGREASSD